MNKVEKSDTLKRMKSLMSYGMTNESKSNPYSAIEYQKVGADGKMYGIVREGTKYYIKVADNKNNLVTEDFNYIGGFRNRANYAYDGFANAQKNFELKMMAINEAVQNNEYNAATWDLDKKENLVIEATEKMKNEILREKQIMANVNIIGEGCSNQPFCEKPGKEEADTQKKNMKQEKPEPIGKTDNIDGDYEKADIAKTDIKEGEEVLAWHDSNGDPKDDHYMDKSHGTEIGSSDPYDAEVVEEGEVMHNSDNQNVPTPGTSEVGDDAPFDGEKGKQIDEAEDFEEEPIDDEEVDGFGDEEFGDEAADDFEEEIPVDDEVPAEGEEEILDDEAADDDEDAVYIEDIEDRLSSLESLIQKIASAVGVEDEPVDGADYEDEPLFGDDEEEEEVEIEDEPEDEFEFESKNGVKVFESRGYRKAMKRINEENRLNDFGKHPAYRKEPMSVPSPNMPEKEDYYDMNDDSVKNTKPFGSEIGSSAPFEITPEQIANAIAESLRNLKKK